MKPVRVRLVFLTTADGGRRKRPVRVLRAPMQYTTDAEAIARREFYDAQFTFCEIAADGFVDLGREVEADVVFFWPEAHVGKCVKGATFVIFEGKLTARGVFLDDLDLTSCMA